MSKYVRYGDDIILATSDCQMHSDFKESFGTHCKPTSAGSLKVLDSFNKGIKVFCSGDSTSLKLASGGDLDSEFAINALKDNRVVYAVYEFDMVIVLFGINTDDPFKIMETVKDLVHPGLLVFGTLGFEAIGNFECDLQIKDYNFVSYHHEQGKKSIPMITCSGKSDIGKNALFDTGLENIREMYPQWFKDGDFSIKNLEFHVRNYTGLVRDYY